MSSTRKGMRKTSYCLRVVAQSRVPVTTSPERSCLFSFPPDLCISTITSVILRPGQQRVFAGYECPFHGGFEPSVSQRVKNFVITSRNVTSDRSYTHLTLFTCKPLTHLHGVHTPTLDLASQPLYLLKEQLYFSPDEANHHQSVVVLTTR